MTEAPVVEMKGVYAGYGGEPVLRDINLVIRERDFAAVVGPNGGGKTTLLKLALGLLKPYRGEVRLFGAPPARTRRRAGYVPQSFRYDPSFPVRAIDVVRMGCDKDLAAAEAALHEVGMCEVRGRKFGDLSGGQRQRVLIARALASRPEVLLLDEPTANVDTMAEAGIYELLGELNLRLTVVIVTHDIAFASSHVGTVLCVNRVLVTHPVEELTGESIRALYAHDVTMVRHDLELPGPA